MKYEVVRRIKDSEDTVLIGSKTYTIRFSAKHAEHIIENKFEPAHNIGFKEIVTLVKDSIIISTTSIKYVAIGRFKRKIYETYFYLTRDRIDIVTSFASNKPQIIEFYKKYEKDNH